jgi:hypothetical protein
MSIFSLPVILIIIGIALALLVSWALGVVVVVIGLVLLIWPLVTQRSARA